MGGLAWLGMVALQIIVFVLLAGAAVWLFRAVVVWITHVVLQEVRVDSSLSRAARRYVDGELTREEYQTIRDTIEGPEARHGRKRRPRGQVMSRAEFLQGRNPVE